MPPPPPCLPNSPHPLSCSRAKTRGANGRTSERPAGCVIVEFGWTGGRVWWVWSLGGGGLHGRAGGAGGRWADGRAALRCPFACARVRVGPPFPPPRTRSGASASLRRPRSGLQPLLPQLKPPRVPAQVLPSKAPIRLGPARSSGPELGAARRVPCCSSSTYTITVLQFPLRFQNAGSARPWHVHNVRLPSCFFSFLWPCLYVTS